MRRRRTRAVNLAGSPTLVGAVTVLIVVVAVFLAYNANNGLPFVQTYKISVEVPNASTLVPGNDVRVGGVRVGQVSSIEPEAAPNGSVSAKVDLKLDKDMQPLATDSTVIVRSRSALGLKYLELNPGHSSQGLQEGGTLPLSAARPEPVEIDQVFNIFDQPTRDAIQTNLTEFGNALAGRGQQLNNAIGELRPLVAGLTPVMNNLGSPQTGLRGFVDALSATAGEVAPVAGAQANLFVALDTTFGAIANVSRPFIQDAIAKTPATERTLISTGPKIRPFINHTAGLFADLAPGFHAISPAAELYQATVKGIPALNAAPAFNAQLDPTAQALLDFNNNASARQGISSLTNLTQTLNPTLAFITPAQSVCNYGTLLFRNVASVLSLGDGLGTWQRFIPLNPPSGPNSEGSPASAPANGGTAAGDNFLHYNPYPNTAAPGQVHECEAGNEPFLAGQTVIGNVPGNQGTVTEGQLAATNTKCKKGQHKNKNGTCVKTKPKKGKH